MTEMHEEGNGGKGNKGSNVKKNSLKQTDILRSALLPRGGMYLGVGGYVPTGPRCVSEIASHKGRKERKTPSESESFCEKGNPWGILRIRF